VPLSAAPTRRILRGSGIVDRRMPHGPPAMSRNQPSDAASSTSAAQADQPTIGIRIVHQRCRASQPTIGIRIVHQCCPSEPTNHRMPHRPPALPKRTNQPSDAASSTSAAQADQPTIGCPHRLPALPKRTNQPSDANIVHQRRPNKSKSTAPVKRSAHSHRGGIGDSTLHSRNSLAFACRRLSANSVSLHARTVCSSLSQLQPARSCIPALGSERSFS